MQHDLILFHKPFGVLCQFTGPAPTLADHIDLQGFYPAGRLDKDSEGLLILTNSGALQARITEPTQKMAKTYWVQVEGECQDQSVQALQNGVTLKDGLTRPAKVRVIAPALPPRSPPHPIATTSGNQLARDHPNGRQESPSSAHDGSCGAPNPEII